MEQQLPYPEWLEVSKYSEGTQKAYYYHYRRIQDMDLNQAKVNRLCQEYPSRIFRAFLKNYIGYKDMPRLQVPRLRGRTKKTIPKYWSLEDLNYLKDMVNPRLRLIINLLFETAFRVSELIRVRVMDINFDEKIIRVMGKGNKEYLGFIDSGTIKDILDYTYNMEMSERIFPISRQRVFILLRDASESIVGKRLTPHMIRHSFATFAKSSGLMDLQELQYYLGHESLTTTGIYSHIQKEDIESKWRKLMKDE